MDDSDMEQTTGKKDESPPGLPVCAEQFITAVVRKMGYRKRVRQEVREELTAHFEDELRDVTDAAEREKSAKRLIQEFGDAGLLAILCRRAKKRCRPLWVRAFVRTMQIVGVFLLVFIPYTIWFVRGKANPTIDYLPQLNALHRPSGPIEDNAWPYYERALRLVIEPNETVLRASWFKSLNAPEKPLVPQDWKAIEDWISLNSSAWSQVEFAVVQKYCHRIYQRVPGLPLWYSWDNPPMAKLRRLVQLGLWTSRLAMEQEHVDNALDTCLTLLLIGAHWQKNALLIDQLMAHAMSQAICREIVRIAETTHLSGSQLSDLQTRLLQAYRDGYPHMSFDGERLIVLDLIQYCFTRGGPGGGHVVTMDYFADLHKTIGFPNTDVSAPSGMMASSVNAALTMMHASRDRTIVKLDQVNNRLRGIAGLSPYEQRSGGFRDWGDRVGAIEMRRYGLVYHLLPAQRRASEVSFRARAEYEALVAIVAIKKYRVEKADYPREFEALIREGYLTELPMDPYSDAPLVYRPTGDDFILYSLGLNFTDDGGQPGRDEEGRPKLWGVDGDAVFWPVNR